MSTSVYFIQVGKYVKVGISENPERRCERLFSSSTQYAAPWDCPKERPARRLLGYVPGRLGDEFAAHQALSDFAVGCEFFIDEQPVRDYMARCIDAGRVLHEESIERADGPHPFVGQVEPDPEAEAKLKAALDRIWVKVSAAREKASA